MAYSSLIVECDYNYNIHCQTMIVKTSDYEDGTKCDITSPLCTLNFVHWSRIALFLLQNQKKKRNFSFKVSMGKQV